MSTKTLQKKQHIALVAQQAVDALPNAQTTLIVNDREGLFSDHANHWHRFATASRQGSNWPQDGSFTDVFIRLLPDKTAMNMAIHAVAKQMPAQAALWIVGANDEGIKSVRKLLDPLFTDCETLETRRRCRLLKATRTDHPLETQLAAWKTVKDITIDGKTTAWVSYPGLFAKGKLDPATELLLEVTKGIRPKRRVLDFGCGTGTISFAIRNRFGSIPIDALDHDALAVLACTQNVPGIQCFNSDGWSNLPPDTKYDLIISNPPIHSGKEEDITILQDLVEQSAKRLTRRGSLFLVTQKRIPINWEPFFPKSSIVAQSNRYKVVQYHY